MHCAIKNILLLFLVTFIICESPGFKASVSKKGLIYAKDVGLQVLEKTLQHIEVPNQGGDVDTPIGPVEWHLTSIVISGVKFPFSDITILPQYGLGIRLSVIIQVQFLWSYKHKTIPFLQDSGSGIIKVTQSDSAISLEIYTENGMARVKVKNSYINIQEFTLTLSGGASWFYNLLINLFKGLIKPLIQDAVKAAVDQEVPKLLNEFLSRIPTVVPLPWDIGLDYSFVSNPTFEPEFFALHSRGLFFNMKNRDDCKDCRRTELPPDVALNKMILLQLSDYTVNTAGHEFTRAGVLKATITNEMIPDWSPVKLNTKNFKAMIPPLYKMYPDMDMEVTVEETKHPDFIIDVKGARAIGFGEAKVDVVLPDNTKKHAFTLGGNFSCAGYAYLKDNRISGSLSYMEMNSFLKETNIGEFNVKMLDNLLNLLLEKGIIPAINKMLQPGFPLPLPLEGVELTEPELTWQKGYLQVATNVKYTPQH